jgi:hypothetical protein
MPGLILEQKQHRQRQVHCHKSEVSMSAAKHLSNLLQGSKGLGHELDGLVVQGFPFYFGVHIPAPASSRCRPAHGHHESATARLLRGAVLLILNSYPCYVRKLCRVAARSRCSIRAAVYGSKGVLWRFYRELWNSTAPMEKASLMLGGRLRMLS